MKDDAAMVQEQVGRTQADAMAAVAGKIPPPREPLDPATFNAMVETLERAVEDLSGGEIPMPEAPEVTEPIESVPAPVAAMVATLAEFFGQVPEGEPYRFDAGEMLGSNKGLRELTGLLDQACSDKALVKATTKGSSAAAKAPPPKPAAPPEKKGVDDLMGGA